MQQQRLTQMEQIELGLAPRKAEAWRQVQEILTDGKWHKSLTMAVEVGDRTGLKITTVQAVMRDAARSFRLVRKQQRGYAYYRQPQP